MMCMSYDESAKKSTIKYIKEKQHEIKLRYKKEEYEKYVLPSVIKSGLPLATYIKQAVYEKIKEDEATELKAVLERVKEAAVINIPQIMNDDCRQIILYGSYARGDFSSDSDVDIAVLTSCDREQAKVYSSQIDDLAADIGISTMTIVNFVCLPIDEFEEKKAWYPYFINIAKDGVTLYER